jgi:hypothetical protein
MTASQTLSFQRIAGPVGVSRRVAESQSRRVAESQNSTESHLIAGQLSRISIILLRIAY